MMKFMLNVLTSYVCYENVKLDQILHVDKTGFPRPSHIAV